MQSQRPQIDVSDLVATVETDIATVTVELDEQRIEDAEKTLFPADRDVSSDAWMSAAFEQASEALQSTAGEL